jgi:large subunit ribosomal protein L19
MKHPIIEAFEARVLPTPAPRPIFRPGDSLRVHYKIEESTKGEDGEKKYRIQIFEGVCLRYRKGLVNGSFTIRKIGANSVGVERVFPLQSPYIDKLELVSGGKVRRARLYYLRNLSGKSARIKARRLSAAQLKSII